jgi:putative ABC transport system permease protein
MLAVEGMLISGIGAFSGIVLGVLYGWAGATATIGALWDPVLTVPFINLLPVFLGGMVVGLLASVLPGRKAARTSPVSALGEE